MASSSQPSADASSTQGKSKDSKDSKAPMSLNTLLNHTVSQLPTPDVSPNQPVIDDLSETPSGTQVITPPASNGNSDYVLLSPSRTDSLPPLFPRNRLGSPSPPQTASPSHPQEFRSYIHRVSPSRQVASPPHSRNSSQSSASDQLRSRSATVEPSTIHSELRSARIPLHGAMPDQWARLTYLGPVNPNDPEGPREAVLQSQSWRNAAIYRQQYSEMVMRTNLATYASGDAPALNMLADVGAARLSAQNGSPTNRRFASNSRISQLQRRPGQDLSEHPFASPRAAASRTTASRNTAPQATPARTTTSRPASSRSTRCRRRASEDADAPPAKRQRSEPTKKTKYKSFEDIVDYCPPINTERLKEPFSVDQKTNKIDLSNEPQDLRTRMTKTELDLASNLRLDCNSYLINKRLIFKGKVDHLIKKQTFSKTHAQQWGVIDVNKSSLLFTYFEKAGWMEPEVFTQFIAQEKERRAREKVVEANNGTAVVVTVA